MIDDIEIPDFLKTDDPEPLPDRESLPEQLPLLAKEAREAEQEKERNRAAYTEYQHNIAAAGTLRSDILKGLKEGRSICRLFLQSCEIISLMTGESLFYNTVKADILEIYGEGLAQPEPLSLEIQETRDRLERLTAAAEKDPAGQRITGAIKAHRERLSYLEGKQRR